MGRSVFAFVMGIGVGALGVVLVQRLRDVVFEEDAEDLIEKLSEQLDRLERADRAHTARRVGV